MSNREESLLIIEKRLAILHAEYQLNYFKRNSTDLLGENNIPLILIAEGTDKIIKKNNRGTSSQNVRQLNVIIECWDDASTVKDLLASVKTKIEAGGLRIINDISFIDEGPTVGPFQLPFPKKMGMRIIYTLTYLE